MSVHNNAKKGDIAESILLPGDPLRAKFIAENYLENVVCYNEVRNMLGFTGTYKGKKVSVQGTGMGIPSISIYVHELMAEYGCKNLIRVGTCGSFHESIKCKDVILATGACTDSSLNRNRFNGNDYSPVPDFDLALAAVNAAKNLNFNLKKGLIYSSDNFYGDNPNWYKTWSEYGVLGVEMEAAALYTLAKKFNARALCLVTVSDHLVTHEATTAEERQSTFTKMIEVALDATISV